MTRFPTSTVHVRRVMRVQEARSPNFDPCEGPIERIGGTCSPRACIRRTPVSVSTSRTCYELGDEALEGASEETSRFVIVGGVDLLTVLQVVEAEECGRHHQLLTRE